MARAYITSDVTFRAAPEAEMSRTRGQAAIAQHSGRYLVRRGAIEVLRGPWTPSAIVIVEFPSMAAARAWYRSREYAKALEVRDRAPSRNLILAEGVAPPA